MRESFITQYLYECLNRVSRDIDRDIDRDSDRDSDIDTFNIIVLKKNHLCDYIGLLM